MRREDGSGDWKDVIASFEEGGRMWPGGRVQRIGRLGLTYIHLFSGCFVTSWTVAHQAPLSMGFSRQEYWSGLPFPSPGDLPHLDTEP